MKTKPSEKASLVAALDMTFGSLKNPAIAYSKPATIKPRQWEALLSLCPCLFNQVEEKPTARAIVHFCEMTLGKPIMSSNAYEAFLVQHPKSLSFKYPPIEQPTEGGAIMEMLCSEVLANEGLPAMQQEKDGWPTWNMPGHILLNEGKMSALKAFGDILIPCAPTNIVISVKSERARERLLYSANSIEGVGFGFFNQPNEFWTQSRMTLYKRMGFSAIYMPHDTHKKVMEKLGEKKSTRHAVNINGGELYRPLTAFGGDMKRIVGRSSMLL